MISTIITMAMSMSTVKLPGSMPVELSLCNGLYKEDAQGRGVYRPPACRLHEKLETARHDKLIMVQHNKLITTQRNKLVISRHKKLA
jgi:hypothetical protein